MFCLVWPVPTCFLLHMMTYYNVSSFLPYQFVCVWCRFSNCGAPGLAKSSFSTSLIPSWISFSSCNCVSSTSVWTHPPFIPLLHTTLGQTRSILKILFLWLLLLLLILFQSLHPAAQALPLIFNFHVCFSFIYNAAVPFIKVRMSVKAERAGQRFSCKCYAMRHLVQ